MKCTLVKHFLYARYLTGARAVMVIFTYSIPEDHPPDKYQENPHFTDEGTEAKRGDLNCLRPRTLKPELNSRALFV